MTKSAYRSYTPFIRKSTLGVKGSVKSKNFVPVSVWEQDKRKNWVSIVSMPVEATPGFGTVEPPVEEGRRGVRDLVMACTLRRSAFAARCRKILGGAAPMEGAGEDEIVICIDALQAWVELPLVNQATSLVNDY